MAEEQLTATACYIFPRRCKAQAPPDRQHCIQPLVSRTCGHRPLSQQLRQCLPATPANTALRGVGAMAIPGVGDMQPMGESRQSNCALWVRPGHIPDMEYLFWRRRLQGILATASDSTMLRLLAADVTELAYHIQWHAEAPHAAQESLTATANTILRDALVCKMCATDHLGTYASFVASTDAISHHYCHQSSCHAHFSSVTHAAFHLFVRSVLLSFLPVMECTWREARNACHVLANSLNMGSASLAPFLFVPVSCFLRSR